MFQASWRDDGTHLEQHLLRFHPSSADYLQHQIPQLSRVHSPFPSVRRPQSRLAFLFVSISNPRRFRRCIVRPSRRFATAGVACWPEPQIASFKPFAKGLMACNIPATCDEVLRVRKHAGFSSRSSSEKYESVIFLCFSLSGRMITSLE